MIEIRMDELQPGDVYASSHGFNVFVREVTTADHPQGMTAIRGDMHREGGHPWNERSERSGIARLLERPGMRVEVKVLSPSGELVFLATLNRLEIPEGSKLVIERCEDSEVLAIVPLGEAVVDG